MQEKINYDQESKVKEIIRLKDEKKHGECLTFQNEQLVEKKTYQNGLLEGPFQKFEKGVLKLFLNYAQDKLNGPCYFFYPSGTVNAISFYKDGKLHGDSFLFNEAGLLIKRQKYQNNELNGQSILYYSSEQVVYEIGQYSNNLKEGLWQKYNQKGEIIEKSKFDHGVLMGKLSA